MADERKPGFYWVKNDELGWIVAQSYLGKWFIPGLDAAFTDGEFEQIEEWRIPAPGEFSELKVEADPQSNELLALRHHHDTTVGLWAIDREPVDGERVKKDEFTRIKSNIIK